PVPVKEKRFFAAALVFILGMSVIVSLVIHSPQRYEKFFILSFCRGEKVICMALWVKIGIHKKKGRSRTNIPGICGVAGEGHRIYAGPYRVPPGRYSFPVLSAGEPVCRGVFWQIFSYAWR
ncbi:hypothetical protein, partial [Alistipes putredinis]|uniref:hypothetical protein n=2 Tax=Alistipes putredinis TaxID=28117 RepID=UPI004029E3CD